MQEKLEKIHFFFLISRKVFFFHHPTTAGAIAKMIKWPCHNSLWFAKLNFAHTCVIDKNYVKSKCALPAACLKFFTTEDMVFCYMPKHDMYSVEKVPILSDNNFVWAYMMYWIFDRIYQKYCHIISELFLRYICRFLACRKKTCHRWWIFQSLIREDTL